MPTESNMSAIRAADELETERLRFRRWRQSDFPTYETWCARIEIMRYLGGKTFDCIQAWRHMAYLVGHWEMLGYGYYAVEEKATGDLVGRVGYTNHPGWPAARVCVRLARPNAGDEPHPPGQRALDSRRGKAWSARGGKDGGAHHACADLCQAPDMN